jgi:hypothetical protein
VGASSAMRSLRVLDRLGRQGRVEAGMTDSRQGTILPEERHTWTEREWAFFKAGAAAVERELGPERDRLRWENANLREAIDFYIRVSEYPVEAAVKAAGLDPWWEED